MVWEIYSYWNIEELRGVLEAVAMLTSTGDYTFLISTMVLFGLVTVGVATMTGKHDVVEGFRWFIIAIFLYLVMFVPKVDVTLIDRTGTEPAKIVNNVPISLGVFGHVTSKIGDWMTTGYETTMGVISPSYITNDGIKFQGNGLLFGEQVLLDAEMAQPENISFRMNMTAFFEKCVFPEFDTGNIPVQTVLNSNDLWGSVSNVNPSLYVQLYNNDGTPTPSPVDCKTAYNSVLPAILNSATDEMLQALGNKNFPDMGDAAAKAAMDSVIAGSYGYYLGVSSAASDVLKQQIMTNTFYNATADSATTTAVTMAQQAAEKNYSVLFNVAQNTIPKLRNVIEVILYAMFPVVLVMIIVGGSKGFPVIKSYIISLAWIQLWAPLYAVMNYLVVSYNQKEFMAHAALGSEISATHSAALGDMVLSNTEIAGMLAMSIPMIAYAIVKGGEMAMTAFVSGATRPIEQNAAMSSREVSQGNINMGNMSMDTKSFSTLSAYDYNTQPSVNRGGPVSMGADNMKHTVNTYGDGSHSTVTDSTGAEQKGAWANYTTAVGQEQRAQTAFNESVSAVSQASSDLNYTNSMIANDVAGQTKGFDISKAASLASTVKDSEAATEGWQAARKAEHKLEEVDGIDKQEALKMSAYVQSELKGGASLGAILETGWSAKGGVKVNADTEMKAKDVLNESYANVDQNEAKEAFALQNEIATNQELRGQLGVTDSTETNISGAVSKQSQQSERLSAALAEKQEATAELSEASTRREEAAINTGAILGHEAYGDAFAAWSRGKGHEALNQLALAEKSGNSNEVSNLAEDARQSFLEFQSTNNFVSSKIAGDVSAPSINPNDREKITATHQGNVDTHTPVSKENNDRTGVDGIRGGVELQNQGREAAFEIQSGSIDGDKQFNKDYNKIFQSELKEASEGKEIRTPSKSTAEEAGRIITEKNDSNPDGESVKGLLSDVNFSGKEEKSLLERAEAAPVGQRNGEEVQAILENRGLYEDNPMSNFFQDEVGYDGIRNMYNNGEITKSELERFSKDSDDLDDSQKLPMNNFINSLPDQPATPQQSDVPQANNPNAEGQPGRAKPQR